MNLREPIYDDIDREFGDLLARLNEADRGWSERAMIWLTAGMALCLVAATAGCALAGVLV